MRNDDMQYWVIGGDYGNDLSFTRVVEGTLQVSGPYADRADALRAWRERSQESRYKATTRLTIAASPNPVAAPAASH